MQRSAQETEEHTDHKYKLTSIEYAFDEQDADPGKVMLDTISSGHQNLQIRQGAQQQSSEYFPMRSSPECAPPASGRSNNQITPRMAENNLQAVSSRQSLN